MNRKLAVLALLAVIALSLTACIVDPVPVEVEKFAPVVGFASYQRPNGDPPDAPYQYHIYGTGHDPDGYIVQWIIRIGGSTYRVGPNPDKINRPFDSEHVWHQFPGPGNYNISVTAIDNDGLSTTFYPNRGVWPVTH